MNTSVIVRPGVALAATPGTALRAAALLTLLVETVVHVYLAPDHLEEMPYIGVGFVLGAVLSAAVMAAVLVAASRVRTWVAGAVLCAGMAVLFVASRTVGLPGYRESWTSDHSLGLIATATELVFVGCALAACSPSARRR